MVLGGAVLLEGGVWPHLDVAGGDRWPNVAPD